MSVCVSVCLSVHLSLCLSIHSSISKFVFQLLNPGTFSMKGLHWHVFSALDIVNLDFVDLGIVNRVLPARAARLLEVQTAWAIKVLESHVSKAVHG